MRNNGLRPNDLIVRCLAERRGDYWVAFCLDFNLAAQGDSYDDVHRRIVAQIREYVYDALVGEDRAHAHQLMHRRAPFSLWLRFYWARLRQHFRSNGANNGGSKGARPFCDPLPLTPTHA